MIRQNLMPFNIATETDKKPSDVLSLTSDSLTIGFLPLAILQEEDSRTEVFHQGNSVVYATLRALDLRSITVMR